MWYYKTCLLNETLKSSEIYLFCTSLWWKHVLSSRFLKYMAYSVRYTRTPAAVHQPIFPDLPPTSLSPAFAWPALMPSQLIDRLCTHFLNSTALQLALSRSLGPVSVLNLGSFPDFNVWPLLICLFVCLLVYLLGLPLYCFSAPR